MATSRSFVHKWFLSQTLTPLTGDQLQQNAEDALAAKGTLMGDPIP